MKVILFVLLALGLAAANPLDLKQKYRRAYKNLFKRGPFDCVTLGDECGNFGHCCDEDQCYFENGRGAFSTGVCVTCVQQNLVCQRDVNCCEGLQCDKESDYGTNGLCKPPRAYGQQCWEDSQCASGQCSDDFFHPSGHCE